MAFIKRHTISTSLDFENFDKGVNSEDIISDINGQVSFILNDCKTLLWVRSSQKRYYSLASSKYNIGGGNFLETLGLFSILNFLSKTYCILRKGTRKIKDKVLIAKLENFKRDNASLLNKFKSKLNFELIEKPEINEEDAFYKLVKDSNIFPYLNETEIRSVWKFNRNYLSHVAFTPVTQITYALTERISVNNLIAKINKSKDNSILCDNGSIVICLVDKLYTDVIRMTKWLCNEVKSSSYPTENLQDLKLWIFNSRIKVINRKLK